MYSVIDISKLSVVSIKYCFTCGGTRNVRVVMLPVGILGGRPGRAFIGGNTSVRIDSNSQLQ